MFVCLTMVFVCLWSWVVCCLFDGLFVACVLVCLRRVCRIAGRCVVCVFVLVTWLFGLSHACLFDCLIV